MTLEARNDCMNAIAYLKQEIPESENEEVLILPYEDSMVLSPFGHGLLTTYVVDKGDKLSFIQNRDLIDAGLTQEQLHVQAIKNLATYAEEHMEVREYGNIYVVLMGGNFESSIILWEHFWSELVAHLAPNGFVAALPARDILAFGDASSTLALNELRAVCERGAGKADHPLTLSLLRRVNQSWEPHHG